MARSTKPLPRPYRTRIASKIANAASTQALSATALVPIPSAGACDETTGLRVHGTVRTADNNPIPGATVAAFDRDLRKEQPLGNAKTNKLGQYTISYGPKMFQLGEVPSATVPNLIVRAYDLQGEQIGNDVVPANPSRDQEVNFKVSGPTISEWEALSTGVKPLLAGQGKDDQDLPEEELTAADLDFIAGETGLDREKLRLWTLAFAVSRSAAGGGVAPAIFYGWFRLGLPTEPGALWSTATDKLMATLTAAIKQTIVPVSVAADPPALSGLLDQIKLDRVLQTPALSTSTPLTNLLATLPTRLALSTDQQRVVAGAIANLRPSDPQLVDQIKNLPGFNGDAASVARTLRLGALTSGHLPLIAALQSRLDDAKESEGALKPLTALRPDEWLDLAYTHGTPQGITATPVAYAGALSAAVEQQYPHAALVAHITDGRRLAQHPALAEVGTFLSANPDFDIVAANINAVESKSKLDGVKQPGQLVEGLRSLQRMNTLGASWEETAGLLENDIYSPHQILNAGPTQLAATLAGRIAPERASALFDQAKNLHDVTLGAFTAGFSQLSAPQILPADSNSRGLSKSEAGTLAEQVGQSLASRKGALTLAGFKVPSFRNTAPSGAVADERIEETYVAVKPPNFVGSVLENQPTLQYLFGPHDACSCGHCGSVLGPAAYFVDLLQFIKNAGTDGTLTDGALLKKLLGRRPDLQDIELSCNNTNTEVPSIDLALEILENAVALPLDVDLPEGTTISQQLPAPINPDVAVEVGDEIKKALKRTVRSLPDDVRGTRDETAHGSEWTVVDGRRRWKLTAQEVDDLHE